MTHKERMAIVDKIANHDVLARKWRLAGAFDIETRQHYDHIAATHELKALQFRNMLAMDSMIKREAKFNAYSDARHGLEVIYG